MEQIDSLDRRALGILSDTIIEHLGASDSVSKEVERAYKSGKITDQERATSVFNSLPGWQRNMIGYAADNRAREIVSLKTFTSERDWRYLENLDAGSFKRDSDLAPLPRFLLNRDAEED